MGQKRSTKAADGRKSGSYRVFLSHAERDRGVAELIRHALAEAGLKAIWEDRISIDASALPRLRRAFADCTAVVFLITGSSASSQKVALEVGMALAFDKPIYVLFDGLELDEIPDYLKKYPIRRISEMDKVVRKIAPRRIRPRNSSAAN